jgi:hypothetical protein
MRLVFALFLLLCCPITPAPFPSCLKDSLKSPPHLCLGATVANDDESRMNCLCCQTRNEMLDVAEQQPVLHKYVRAMRERRVVVVIEYFSTIGSGWLRSGYTTCPSLRANCIEGPTCELPGMHLPRTWVNRPREGHGKIHRQIIAARYSQSLGQYSGR